MKTSSNSSTKQARVCLGLTSQTLMPSDVTRLIGVSPTRQYIKGEMSPGKRVPRPWGCWALEIESNDVEDAIRSILAVLGDKKDVIDKAAKTYSATVSASIWWEPAGGQGGYSLSSELLVSFLSLAQRVDFYFASTGSPDE